MAKAKVTPKPKSSAKKPVKKTIKTPSQKTARKSKKPDEPSDVIRYCSYCGHSNKEVMALIAGPTSFICDGCVEVCVAILLDDENPHKDTPKKWRKRITDLLTTPNKFNIKSVQDKGKSPKTRKR